MKKLFWKLKRENNTYKLESRGLPVLLLELLRLPITIFKFIFNSIDNTINKLIQVKSKEIHIKWKPYATKTEIKKAEHKIYKQLLNNH